MTADNADSSNRRDFFRDAVRRVVTPLADYLDQRVGCQLTDRIVLRPPGAIEEARFADTCRRCGACIAVCPAVAIFPLDDTHGESAGTPAIDPDQAACVLCEGLKCTHGCPSGALLPVGDEHLVHMGLAEVYAPLCDRATGEPCTLCVDRCPLGSEAITIHGLAPPEVLAAGCVGCGVCQLYCPTTPTAIVVKPARGARDSAPG